MTDTVKSTSEYLEEVRDTADRWRAEGDDKCSAALLSAHGLVEGENT